MNEVLYLYGFVPHAAPEPAELRGVGGAAVSLIDLGGLSAVVSAVPAVEYSAERIESRLQDLGWVGEQGLAHESVVTWYADHSDVLPARMFSLYSGEAVLRDSVVRDLPVIAHALATIASRREWNLKVAYEAGTLAEKGAELSAELQRADAEIAAAPPGRQYLLRRKRNELLKQELSHMARTAADRMLEALSRHADDTRVLPLGAADETGTVVLNAALLVARPAEEALRAEAAKLYDHYTGLGMIVSFSGPWAPYRFLEHNGEA